MGAERFWTKVAKGQADECWEWQGAKHPFGYGDIRWGGRTERAHRVAWLLTHGPVPEGQCVCHTCDNPPCCNPAHLFVGSKADNLRDMREKGRDSKPPLLAGERSRTAKLTADDVENIRSNRTNLTGTALADLFGVRPAAISDILRRKTWKHV